MTEYLLLLKISPGKVIEVMNSLRSLSSKPSNGVDMNYVMNIFGTWDVGLWFKSKESAEAVNFVYKNVREMPGVEDAHAVPTFPHEE